jgi:thioredoxin-dependent peroxiredoxin
MLETKQMIPDFTLDSSEGFEVSASQYRGKRNLVIAFLGTVPGAATEWLASVAPHADDLEEENARVLVIVEDTAEQARELHEELGAPFIFLADCDGEVHRRFGVVPSEGKAAHAVFITDRYGEIYSVHRTGAGDTLPNAAEVIASLRHINIMCDE